MADAQPWLATRLDTPGIEHVTHFNNAGMPHSVPLLAVCWVQVHLACSSRIRWVKQLYHLCSAALTCG